MNASELMQLVNDVEREFCVLDWRAADVHIWPLLRIRLFIDLWGQFHCANEKGEDKKTARMPAAVERIGRVLRGATRQVSVRLTDRARNDQIDRRADVLFVSDGVSFTSIDGKYTERFCDPLIDEIENRKLDALLWTPGHTCPAPRLRASAHIQPWVDCGNVLGALQSKLGDTSFELPNYDQFLSYLAKRKLSAPVLLPSRVRQDAGRLLALRRWYEKMLQRVQPSMVAVVGYYGLEMMALLAACRSCGIRSVDLQHGVQGELHIAYGRWTKVPIEGFHILPDYFWCWSDAEARAINAWRTEKTKAHVPLVGGNPWLEQWLQGDSAMVKAYDKLIDDVKCLKPAARHILVTLQFGYADDEFLGPLLSQIGRIDAQVQWWLRLHPTQLNLATELEARISKLGLSNVNVSEATQLPLYALLRHMNAHITHSSSTVLEAEMFGVVTIVASTFGAEVFAAEIRRGVATYCDIRSGSFSTVLDACIAQTISRPAMHSSKVAQCMDRLLAAVEI